MKPEILVLLQIYSNQIVTFDRIIEFQTLILSKLEGYSPELTALFRKQIDDELTLKCSEFLQKTLSIFRQSYPECFDSSETIEELLKRISLQ